MRRLKKYKCARCEHRFSSMITLRRHSRRHLASLRELNMLIEGNMPPENKLGSEFRGRNRIIVS